MGDKTENPIPSKGEDLSLGVSERVGFEGTTPSSLGMGRNEDSGKPDGPQKGSAGDGCSWG